MKKRNVGRINFLGVDVRRAITNASEVIGNIRRTMMGRGMAIFGKNKFVSPIYLVKLIANIVMIVIRMPGQFFRKVRISGGDVNAQETVTKIIVAVGSQKVML